MPKYSVNEVLEIIKSFTDQERRELQQQLPDVLNTAATPSSSAQSQNMSGISISDSRGVEMSQMQAGESSNVVPTRTQAAIRNTDLPAALELLKQMKQNIAESKELNSIEKKTIKVPIDTIETELKKPKPDRSLIDQAVEALKKGLAGVEVLAGPVKRVSELIAKAWIVI